MAISEDRKQAFENKYSNDEKTLFRARARRNKLLGNWAASRMKKEGADLEEYSNSIIMADMLETGDEGLKRKLMEDFKEYEKQGGEPMPEFAINMVMEQMMKTALDEIKMTRFIDDAREENDKKRGA